MSIIGKLFASDAIGRDDPWPDRSYVPTEALRDWWVVDCWFHKNAGLAAAHYDALIHWISENTPASLPYLSWAPYTKLRIDLACLKAAPAPEVEKRYKNLSHRYYLIAFCYARNEYADVEQYQSAWLQSEEYQSLVPMLGGPKPAWSREPFKVTPEWYHHVMVKSSGSQWLGYRGFEERKLADFA